LPSIIGIIKSRRILWVGYVAWMSRMNMNYWWESQKEWDYKED
jgi:hypothetical protein